MSAKQKKLTDTQYRRIQDGRLIEQGFRNCEIIMGPQIKAVQNSIG